MIHPLRSIRALLGLLTLLALSACILGRTYEDVPIRPENIAKIQIGKSTKADVLEIFGPPLEYRPIPGSRFTFGPFSSGANYIQFVTQSDRELDHYTYTYSRENLKGVVLILYNYYKQNNKADVLMFLFDEKGVVKTVSFRKGTDEL